MMEEKAIIDKVREYIAECPYLKEKTELNVDYLTDSVIAYSINENVGYNPIRNEFLEGSEMQFLFTFDSKLYWSEDIQNNINNSKFFENFRKWLKENNKKEIFPDIQGVYEIGANTKGYIFATSENEAIYRIQCYIYYFEKEG